jgi:hypothetical protein
MNDEKQDCGWVKLYHPGGALVTLPVFTDRMMTAEVAGMVLESVSNYLTAGWMVNLPGLEAGETVEEIGHVVRREKANDDGTATPVVDLYPARGNFRILGLYLNSPDDIKTFESACGLRLESLMLYEADNTIERGKNPKLEKYVRTLAKSAKVVWKQNPKWEGDEDKKHPKRIFVRWEGVQPSNAAQPEKQEIKRVYKDGSLVNGNEGERLAFDQYFQATGTSPASLEGLRAWKTAQAKKEG